jgi:hypothetical protein
MHPLVTALIQQQEAEGLGNNAFARRLGIDKGTWSNVRRGIEQPAGSVFAAAFRTYPEVVRKAAEVLEISINEDEETQHTAEALAS